MAMIQCDIAIVGGELNGLIAAALLASKGERVIVFESENSFPESSLPDLSETIPVLWPNCNHGEFDSVFAELEIKAELKRHFKKGLPFAVIKDPRNRVICSSFGHSFFLELERIAGRESPSIVSNLSQWLCAQKDSISVHTQKKDISHYIKAAKSTVNKKKTFPEQKLPDEIFGSLRTYAWTLIPFLQFSTSPKEEIGAYLAGSALVHGIFYPRDPKRSTYSILKQLFRETISRNGGTIHKDKIQTIDIQKNRVRALTTNGDHNFSPQVLIDATLDRSLSSRANCEITKIKLKQYEAPFAPIGQCIVSRWLVPSKSLPDILPRYAIFSQDNTSPKAILGIFDAENKQESKVLVFIGQIEHENIQKTIKQIKQRVSHFLPFAYRQQTHEHIVSGDVARTIWPSFSPSGAEFGGNHIQTPVQNIIRAGRDIVPALGINGEIVSANEVCNIALKLQRKTRMRKLFSF